LIYDVIVAGAGPVGLFLACELHLAGLSVLVLEPQEDPRSPLKRLPFGMRGLSAPSIEGFYRRGLLDEITALQPSKEAHWMDQPGRPGGHFAGIQFYEDKIDRSNWPWRLPGPAGTSMMVEMESLERSLEARAKAMAARTTSATMVWARNAIRSMGRTPFRLRFVNISPGVRPSTESDGRGMENPSAKPALRRVRVDGAPGH